MSARQRGVRASPGQSMELPQGSIKPTFSKAQVPTTSLFLPSSVTLLFLCFLALLVPLTLHFHWALPPPREGFSDPNSFSSLDARRHLHDLVSLGVRHVGSEANEVHAVSLLVRKLEEIRKLASSRVEIEISVQQASGSFSIDFPDSMTQVYRNVTNVVVRLKRRGSVPPHAVLVNAHFDSAIGSPAASDDAVSCGTMLEILQAFSSEPHPFLPEHSLIFLFNGAEETVLQGSHGFITGHPWAREVKVFLNLEAAGAGGKEIVFQTGPGHPWLARMYASVVPHPFASVIAQEVFQSGLVPSDTDFRIFRDFGGIPGIDMAYFVNGYVYHTEYDTAERIPDGSIQRAGENVMTILQALGLSPLVGDPTTDKHGKVVFFDILGLFSVVYPERLAVILNSLVVLGSAVSLYSGISLKKQQLDKPYLGMVLKAVLVTISSWFAAILVNLVTSLLVTYVGCSMSWFSHPTLLLPLYLSPAFLAMAAVHYSWFTSIPTLKAHLCEPSSSHALTLLQAVMLAVLTYLRICSAFFFSISLIFHLIFRCLIWETVLRHTLPRSTFLYNLTFILCQTVSLSLPLILTLVLSSSLLQFLVPIFGRSGNMVPPDLVMALFLAIIICLTFSSLVSFVVYTTSRPLLRVFAVSLALLYMIGLALTLSGAVFPYSGGSQPAPKRLFLQHFNRKFIGRDGSVRLEDSHVLFITADYLDIDPVSSAMPELGASLEKWECSGVFCGLPFYLPLAKYINQYWYLPVPPLEEPPHVSLELVSLEETAHKQRNLTFLMKIPPRVSIFISPRYNHAVTRWSLVESVTPAIPCNHEDPSGDQCFFIFYSRGTGDGSEMFWLELEIEGPPHSNEMVEIVVVTHKLDPPHSATLTSLLSSLPPWVTAIGWTATYTSWTF